MVTARVWTHDLFLKRPAPYLIDQKCNLYNVCSGKNKARESSDCYLIPTVLQQEAFSSIRFRNPIPTLNEHAE